MGKGDLNLIPESQILGEKQLLQIAMPCAHMHDIGAHVPTL